jgi:hypothetical protein
VLGLINPSRVQIPVSSPPDQRKRQAPCTHGAWCSGGSSPLPATPRSHASAPRTDQPSIAHIQRAPRPQVWVLHRPEPRTLCSPSGSCSVGWPTATDDAPPQRTRRTTVRTPIRTPGPHSQPRALAVPHPGSLRDHLTGATLRTQVGSCYPSDLPNGYRAVSRRRAPPHSRSHIVPLDTARSGCASRWDSGKTPAYSKGRDISRSPGYFSVT